MNVYELEVHKKANNNNHYDININAKYKQFKQSYQLSLELTMKKELNESKMNQKYNPHSFRLIKH